MTINPTYAAAAGLVVLALWAAAPFLHFVAAVCLMLLGGADFTFLRFLPTH